MWEKVLSYTKSKLGCGFNLKNSHTAVEENLENNIISSYIII